MDLKQTLTKTSNVDENMYKVTEQGGIGIL